MNDAYADEQVDVPVVNSGYRAPGIAGSGWEIRDPGPDYLSAYANFSSDLDTLSRFVTYRKLVLFVDDSISSAIPVLRDAAIETSRSKGLELVLITHDGTDHRLMNRVPEGTDA